MIEKVENFFQKEENNVKRWLSALFMMVLMLTSLVGPAFAEDQPKKLSVKLSIEPSKKTYNTGEPLTLKAETSYKSFIYNVKIFVNDQEGLVTHSSEIQGSKIITTGTFIPQTAGKHKIRYEIQMLDLMSGTQWYGKAEKEIKAEFGKIDVSLSPQTATMKLGDDIYLLVKYPTTQINADKPHTVRTSVNAEEIALDAPTQNGYYQKLYRFTPEKSGTVKFTVTVSQDLGNGQKREGSATVSISVRK
jgi:hypothetical protein